jgi:ribosomal protein S18 acetylase RimI-like enzyme
MTVETLEPIESSATDYLQIAEAPDVPGLRFRHFRGESDFPHMVKVIERANEADGLEEVSTVENMRESYANLRHSDPYQDVVIIEGNGEVVGYKRVEWWAELDGTLIYAHFYNLAPEWRSKELERALVRHSEARLREKAQEENHSTEVARLFDTGSYSIQTDKVEVLLEEGYEPVRHWFDMVRPDLENLPDIPMPEGLETRPVTPDQYRAVWEAEVEAFQDHWGMDQTEEGDFERWMHAWPITFQPHLWQVAWDIETNQVAGMVRNFIINEENERYGRKRGYTENISVRRPWRRRGLARALIASSFRLLKEKGMEQAALGVDTENPSGALQLYQSMGFEEIRHGSSYRKKL